MFTNCSFDLTKSKLYCYRGKDCIKRFYNDLKQHATQIINYEKERNDTLTDEQNNSYKNKKYVIYAKKDLALMMLIKA